MRNVSAFQPRRPVYLNGSTHSLDLELSSSQYASIADASQTGLDLTTGFTFEAWIKIEQLPSTATTPFQIISKNRESTNQRGYMLSLTTSDKLQIFTSSTGTFSVGTTTETLTDAAIVTSADVGVWFHLAVSYLASTKTFGIYKNGSSVANTKSLNAATSIFNNTSVFVIGADNEGTNRYFDGLIDDVRAWDDIRTQAEIQDNMLIELQGNEANLVGYWKLNNSYLDETTNNNDLTASGSPVFSGDLPFSTASNTTKAYYPLNGNSRDYSGNTNTGTDTAITYPQGRFGQGAKFNGTSSFINGGTSTSLRFSPSVTQVVWFRNTISGTAGYFLAGKWSNNTGGWISYGMYMNNGAVGNLFWRIKTGTGVTFSDISVNSLKINDNQWHCAVGTYDAGTQRLYLDGRLVGSGGSGTSIYYDSDFNFLIGAGCNAGLGNDVFYNGIIDEVIIESRAWTAKEVETYYRKSMLNYKQKTFGSAFAAYLLDIATGAYTYTGIATLLTSARIMAAAVGSYVLTGIDVLFSLGKGIAIDVGTFALTGIATTLTSTRTMAAAVGAFTLTGIDVLLKKASTLVAEVGAYILTGIDVILRSPYIWTNTTKNSSTWTDETKHSSTFTNESKNSSTWTNEDKS